MKRKIVISAALLIILAAVIALNAEYLTSKARSAMIGSVVEDIPGTAPENTYPLILLHGFNPGYRKRISEFSMKEMQEDLAQDLNYVDKGLLTTTTTCAELRYANNPIIIRASYFGELELLEMDTYAKNFADIIAKIQHCTGAKQVDVVAHSMGGIVVRYYIQNIDQPSIRKFIMLATPNHGGLYPFGDIADYLIKDGESRLNLDFIELSENHDFMQALNEDETLGAVASYTVAGDIDGKGDGMVLTSSVRLQGEADHTVVPCGHILIKHPSFCPEAYEFVKAVLE